MTEAPETQTPPPPKKKRRGGFFDSAAFVLLLLAVLVSPTQWQLPLGEWLGGLHEKAAALPAVTALDLLLALCFVCFALDVLIRWRWKRVRWLPLPILVLVILAGMSITRVDPESGLRGESIKEFVQWIQIFVIGYLVVANIAAGRRMTAVVAVLGVAMALAVGFAAVQYAQPNIDPVEVRSTFDNRNSYSAYMAIALPLLWGGVVFMKNTAERIGLAIVAIAALVTMLSAGAVVAALAGMLVVGAIRSRGWVFGLVGVVLAAVVLPQVIAIRNPEAVEVWPRPDHLTILDESVSPIDVDPTREDMAIPDPRFYEWAAATKAFQYEYVSAEPRRYLARRMLLGTGIGTFQKNIGEYYDALSMKYNFMKPAVNLTEPGTNSLYVVMAISVGLPAVAALIWLGAEGLGRALRRAMVAEEAFDRAMFVGAAGGLVSLAIVSIFAMPLERGVYFPAILVTGIAYGYAVRYIHNEKARHD